MMLLSVPVIVYLKMSPLAGNIKRIGSHRAIKKHSFSANVAV